MKKYFFFLYRQIILYINNSNWRNYLKCNMCVFYNINLGYIFKEFMCLKNLNNNIYL